MGMRISSSASTAQSTSAANWQQRQQGMKDLFSSLQSGDLGAAQKAFASLNPGNNAIKGNSPMAQIGQALQSGDLAGAQKAEQAMQANRGGRHHHGGQQAPVVASATTPATTSASSTIGTLFNLTA